MSAANCEVFRGESVVCNINELSRFEALARGRAGRTLRFQVSGMSNCSALCDLFCCAFEGRAIVV